MIFLEFIFALVVAALLTIIFAFAFRGRRFGGDLWILFLILLLAAWAGGTWLAPFGPALFGVTWLSFLLVGAFFFLLFAALLGTPRPVGGSNIRTEEDIAIRLNFFLWILIIALVVAIVLAYL